MNLCLEVLDLDLDEPGNLPVHPLLTMNLIIIVY